MLVADAETVRGRHHDRIDNPHAVLDGNAGAFDCTGEES